MQTGTIAFLLGVLLIQLQPALPTSPWWLVTVFVPLAALPLHRHLALIIAVFLADLLWSTLVAQHRLVDSLPAALEGENVLVMGEVVSLPERNSSRTRFVFVIEQLRHRDTIYPVPSRVRLNWYKDAPQLLPGQRWQLMVRMKRPRGMMNPGGFDYEQWLFQKGIGATGYVRSSTSNRLLEDDASGAPVERIRYHLQQHLESALDDAEFGGIIQALAIGERGEIRDQHWALLLATGTNHLMAISGLHIGLVAGLVYFFVLRLWRLSTHCCLWLAAPRAAAIASVLAATAYAMLAGFTVPTQRAMLMLVLVMGAIFLLRPIQSSRLLSLVLILVLIHDPLVVLSAGFWLSFGAVALILFGLSGRINPGATRLGGLWWRWGRVQWVVALGLLPILLLLFGQAALVAPLANFVAVPLVGLLVVPLTLLGTLLLSLWIPAGEWALQLALWLLEFLWPLLEFLAEVLPAMHQAAAPWWCYGIALPGVAWLLAPAGWPLRWAGGVLLLPLLLWQPEPLVRGEARFTLLDVGQGLAAVVETRNRVLVFDTGPRFPSGFNTGQAVILPFMNHRGHSTIDTLIISHGDNDHIGGAHALVENLNVKRVLTSVPHKLGWVTHDVCKRGEQWQWDAVSFELLHPERLVAQGRGNNDSCVLQVRAGGQSLLLTGDIEWEAERELVSSSGKSMQSDILVVPHHGSKTSSSDTFIHAVAPEWVLMPLGYRNRYGFPHTIVTERYRQYGAEILSSSNSGAISFVLGRTALHPLEYRRVARRYWHERDL